MTHSDSYVEIATARLRLKPMTANDAGRVFDIQSNWNVTRMLALARFPPALDELRAWLASHRGEWDDGTAYRFGVALHGRLIGCVDIDGIGEGIGSFGYWFDEAFWGHGFATEAGIAVRDFGFGELGLKKLIAGRAADNAASGRVLHKLGFRSLGTAGTMWSRPRKKEIVQMQYELLRGSSEATA